MVRIFIYPFFSKFQNTAQKMDAISELKDILTKFSGSTCAAENKSPLKHSQQIQELVELSSHIFKDQQTISGIPKQFYEFIKILLSYFCTHLSNSPRIFGFDIAGCI
jgi:hypothetical protein